MSDESAFSTSSNNLFNSASIKTILKSIPAGLIILRKHDGRIVYVNDQAAEIYGVDLSGIEIKDKLSWLKIYTSNGELCQPDRLPGSRALYSGARVQNEQLVIERRDGIRTYVNSSAVPLTNEAGEVTAAIVIFEDITERKKTEELYRSLLDTSFDSFWLADADGRFLDVNKAFLNLSGYSREEILGMSISDVEAKETVEDTAKHLQWIKENGFDYFETLHCRKDGRVIEIQASANYADIDGGRYFGFLHDITKRKRNEAAIKKERDLLQAVMNGAKNVHLVYLDRDFNFVRVNEAYAQTCGYTPEEMIGKNHFALYPNEENEAIFARVRNTGVPASFHDKPFVFPDQPERGVTYWDWTLEPIKNSSGNVEGLVFSLVETTERKRAEEALRNNEEQFRRAVERAPIPIIMQAEDGEVLQVNRAWTELTGYTLKDVASFGAWLNMAYGEGADAVRDHMHDLFKDSKNILNTEFPIYTRDGKIRYWNFSASMLGTLQDNRRFGIGMAVDITQLKQLQGKLEQHAKKLEELVRIRTERLKATERLATIGETAGMVGHDIRNPLQSIIGELYLIKDELGNLPDGDAKESLKESVAVIDEQTAYINKIVTDLQDYARPAAPRMEDVDVDKAIQTAISNMDIPENIEFSYYVQSDFPKLKADTSFLKRILTNLISNAVQAMSDGGKLMITTSAEDEKASISVEDTGGGILEENRDKMFKPLFTTKSKGQGFGLAVCKKLTEAMNGTITFDSQKGKGTRFTVQLPTS